MGIDTGSKLIVGLEYDELPQAVLDECEDGPYDVLSEDGKYGLDSASPYFDSDYDARIWGFSIVSGYWRPTELPENFVELIEQAKAKFRERIGAEPKVYVSAHVT